MNKYQKLINKIAKKEMNEYNAMFCTMQEPVSFNRIRISVKRVHKNSSYGYLKCYYNFYFGISKRG